ncbi:MULTISPECIES: hypothetical protein [unclassified Brevundimonas]|uniref:hypothetical protein n=1 Tax=unclassified Brevundimonas TaxID=2622653 RepID=UPI0025BD3205|nr:MULTISPECIES: hypothetical protein [unclassified Brevundimonas]
MTTHDAPAVPRNLMKLPAKDFVQTAMKTLGLKDPSPAEVNALTQSLLNGENKSRVWAVLEARSRGRPSATPPILPTALVRPDDELAIEEVLVGHALSDDVAFLDYAAFRLAGRALQMHERLDFQAQLNAGLNRSKIVKAIMELSRLEGRNPVVARMDSDTPFMLISGTRRERLVLMMALNERELLVFDDGLSSGSRPEQGALELSEGLIFSGPKKSLKPGLWRLNMNWIQHENSSICVEATANGGLEKLLSMTFAGPCTFSGEFRVLPEHLVCEVLIFALRKGDPADKPWAARPLEVSLAWVGE